VRKDMTAKSYRDWPMYQLAFKLAVEIHRMSLQLPKYEMYEEGSQIRRSSKSIPANVAEGYGRRRYKNDYIKFLVYALASCDETRVHLDLLHKTNELPQKRYDYFTEQYIILGKQLNRFLQSIIKSHQEPYR
jgi:four helix bundle protein